MTVFFGFDLGDAESAVATIDPVSSSAPQIQELAGTKSIVTAYAYTKDGQLLIGEKACYAPDCVTRRDRFKSRFLTDPEAAKDVAAFASGVLADLKRSGTLKNTDEDAVFYIGCPAGWDRNVREEYRQIFAKCGYPPVRIVSESRAALVSACQSRHLQIGYDILHQPVLVIDIGSSTTDFAYINGGKEEELKTGGEVFLGGGIMDEILLEEALNSSPNRKRIQHAFEQSPAWYSYCDFAARRLKERYFSDEEYWADHECVQSVSIHWGMVPMKLTLRMNGEVADHLLNKKVKRLQDRSFREVFMESLQQAKENTALQPPQLIFLTGGVSRMSVIRSWCRQVFGDAVVICGMEPEFSVARGLAYCARIDDELRQFKVDVDHLIASSAVETIVQDNIDTLYKNCVETMVDPILEQVVEPVAERWRNGEIERLVDIDPILQKEVENYLHTDDARKRMSKPASAWLRKVSYQLEDLTMPICVRHHVPYAALSLNTYLSASDVQVNVPAQDLFAVKEITWLIDGTISILIGMLCGGAGTAVISSGPNGIVAGALLSMLVLALGKDQMQTAVLNAKIPKAVRKLIPRSYMHARMGTVSKQVKGQMLKMLEEEKNDEITDRLVRELSQQIEACLVHMAEVVEIPLG